MLFPFALLERSDFAIENGHEKPKQTSIMNSNMPIVYCLFQLFDIAITNPLTA